MQQKASRKSRLFQQIALFRNYVPCGKCQGNCYNEGICCKVCSLTYHQKCLKFSNKKFGNLKGTNTFICSANCLNAELPFHGKDNIDFMSAIFGKGLYPCKKCKNDCLENLDCISCSACNVWVHFSCTKLTEHEFRNKTYFFCCKKCENSVVYPDYSESERTTEQNFSENNDNRRRKRKK